MRFLQGGWRADGLKHRALRRELRCWVFLCGDGLKHRALKKELRCWVFLCADGLKHRAWRRVLRCWVFLCADGLKLRALRKAHRCWVYRYGQMNRAAMQGFRWWIWKRGVGLIPKGGPLYCQGLNCLALVQLRRVCRMVFEGFGPPVSRLFYS
jgi:hypothetical protein